MFGIRIRAARGIDSDSEDDDMPGLIASSVTDDEDSEAEDYLRRPAIKAKVKAKAPLKPKNNAECADMWYKLSKDEKEKHIHVMKVYLLSPFLFGQVYQEDKWINWAYESELLPSKSSFDLKELDEKHFDAVDLIETAFNKLAENALRKNKDGLVKTLDIIASSGLSMSQHLDKAVTCAESFLAFTNLREKIKLKPGIKKRQGDVALLLAHNQVSDHIKKLAAGINLVEEFNTKCKRDEDQTSDQRKKGNDAFSKKMYSRALSIYGLALHMSPYSHVLYGNRAQANLRTKELWAALTDGRRAVVLKADWQKAQYRYAQAFYELGFVLRAKETNRAARKICSNKDLEIQYERFEKGIHSPNEGKEKEAENRTDAKESKMPDDLPALVDANSSDTSRDSDDDCEGPPDLVEMEEDSNDSLHNDSEGQSADNSDGCESDDSSAQKKTTVSTPKERINLKKVRKGVREAIRYQAKQEEKARKEEKEKKMAEHAAKKQNKKIEKRNKKTKLAQLDQNGFSERKREFMAYLRQGSKAILEKNCMVAVRNYRDAMNLLEEHDFQYQVFDMKEIDFVILLYGFGTAHLELGGPEELLEAKKQFDIILVKHKNVIFPLAFLGTGRVFYKQNRFAEALELLERGLAFVNKVCEDLASYRWPGSSVEIDESKPEKLLSAIETLIKNCRHPPRPHAICRYPDCSNKSQIYLTDPDYKGYICLICDKDCKVEFHPVCWKKHKSSQEGKTGDKDFLEDACMTPDCPGIVVDIQIFDADGLKTEFKLEKLHAKMEAKPKAAKQNKVKPSGIAAKQKMKKAKDDVKMDDAASVDTGEEKEPTMTAAASAYMAAQKEEKPSKENHIQVEKGGSAPFDSSVSIPEGEGVFILKKEDDEEPAKGGGKVKTKKKKLKNTQTLDEFLKDRGGQQTFRPGFLETADEVDEITIPKGKFDFGLPPPAWSQHEMEAPFAIPPHLQGDAAQLEASYRESFNIFSTSTLPAPQLDSQPQIDLQAVTDYVSSMLQEILRVNGPLELADPNIMQPLSMLPDNYQDIISNAGGLRPILEQSGEFVFQGNKVMLPEDKEIEDLVQTLKPQSDNPFLVRLSGTNDVKLGKSDRNEIGTEEESHFRPSSPLLVNRTSSTPFNPDAKEFVPSTSKMDLLCNSSSGTSLTSDSGTLKEAELVDDELRKDDTVTEEREQISSESQVENVTISNESKVENEPDSKESNFKTNTISRLSKKENEPVSNASKVKNELVPSESKMENVENETEARNMKKDSVTKEVVAEALTDAAEVKPELSVNETKFEDSTCDVAQTVAIVGPVKDTVCIPSLVDEGTAQTQATFMRSGSEPVITSKTKSILAQPNVKSKGVDTDPIPERYKAEYQRATAEKDALQNIVIQEVIAEASTNTAAVKTESLSVNGTTCDVAQAVAIIASVKDTVCIPPPVDEGTAQLQATFIRSGSEPVITSKTKSIQTQPNVKSKGVGTDPIPERYKAEYQRATAEKDALQTRLHESTERLNILLSKNTAEVDKVKRKLSEAVQEKEKCSKDLQDVKQKSDEEIRKLRQQCEDKEDKIKILNKKLLQDADDKSNVINGLRKELAACKGQFTSEKDSWTKERSEKEELLKNVKLQHQQQQARAQDAEIKLLELRRDVGLRFLERAYQESHVTINNLIQAVNARIAGPKVEELITKWKNYTVECHQRVVQCKDAFNDQIELLKSGRTLASVPQLTIPGPPPYPAIPVLQSLVPGQQQNQPQPQSAAESSTPAARPSDPPLFNATAPAAAPVGVPTASTIPVGGTAAVNGDQANDAVRATAASAAPNLAAAADKARPSNSFEKIMLRLSTMYPNFTRLELTGFIKEVRHNKHGSLTGLSLEDIVTSVSELVEKKKKAGLLRAAPVLPTNNPTTQGSTKPVALPQKTQPAKPVQAVKPIAPEVTKALISGGSYEEDLCVICHDDMNTSNDIVILECGHRYHSTCIRKWLLGEQSTCPTCRVHALLPDEFPRLK